MTTISTADGTAQARRLKLWASMLIVLFDGLAFGILLPLLPFVALRFGASAVLVTQLVAIYALCGFAGSVVIGALSDRFNRAILVKASLLGSLVACAIFLFSWSLPALFLFRALTGLMTGRDAALYALITDNEPKAEHARLLGAVTAASAAGSALGPAVASLAGLLLRDDTAQFQTAFIVVGVLTLLMLVLAVLTWPNPKGGHSAMGGAKFALPPIAAIVPVLGPLTVGALVAYGYAVILSITALFAKTQLSWSTIDIGWLLTIVAAGIVVTRAFAAPLALKRFGNKILPLCIAACVPAYLLIAVSHSSFVFGLGIFLAAILTSAAGVFVNNLVSTRAQEDHRGLLFGVNHALTAIALFLGATVNGLLFEFAGPRAPQIAAAAVLFLALPVALATARRRSAASA